MRPPLIHYDQIDDALVDAILDNHDQPLYRERIADYFGYRHRRFSGPAVVCLDGHYYRRTGPVERLRVTASLAWFRFRRPNNPHRWWRRHRRGSLLDILL